MQKITQVSNIVTNILSHMVFQTYVEIGTKQQVPENFKKISTSGKIPGKLEF